MHLVEQRVLRGRGRHVRAVRLRAAAVRRQVRHRLRLRHRDCRGACAAVRVGAVRNTERMCVFL